MLGFAQQLQAAAAKSGKFRFPPIIDTKLDQPQAEIVIDHDKAAAIGLNLQQVGADLSAMMGGNFVNRFDIAGRAYKVIPQIKRVDRLNPRQLEDIYVTGPDGKLIQLSTIATIRNKVIPRSLNRLQQLNAVTLSGVAIVPIDQALKVLEDEASRILPKGYSVDYTGESRQLRVEGDKFLPAFGLAFILIFLVLAAQFNSFRDPLIILFGSVPLAMFGALIFTFLKMPFAERSILYQRLDDDDEHLFAGRSRHSRRTDLEKWNPDRRVRQQVAAPGLRQSGRSGESRAGAIAADPDDDDRDRGRSLPARARNRRGRQSA